MSLINQMLRDLNARHASASESVLPDEVRALPEPGRRTGLGRARGLAVGALVLLAAGGLVWLMQAPGSAEAPALASAPPDSQNADGASAPVQHSTTALADELVPALPTLTSARPLAPPGTREAAVARGSKDKGASGGKVAANSAIQLKLDELLTFSATQAKSQSVERKKEDAIHGQKLTSDAKAPAMARESSNLTAKDKLDRADKTVRIEKVERGDRGDENFRNGVYAYKQGRMNEAVIQLQAALRENPRHASARQAMLGILVEQRRWDEALALLKEGLELMPEQSGWAMAMARIQVERGNTPEAWVILQRHEAYAGQNAEYQGFAGVLLQHLKKPREAAERYKAALRLRPKEGRWWYALGNALDADNQAAEALEAYKRAQTLGGLTPAMAEAVEKKLR